MNKYNSACHFEKVVLKVNLELPLGLRQALESGDCVLFVGAGIAFHQHGPDGKQAPDGWGLAKELADFFSIEMEELKPLAKVSQIVQLRKGRAELEACLKKRLADLTPDETLIWLSSRRWKAIFTTNYDNGIQRCYELNPQPIQTPITITRTSELVPFDTRVQVPIYHLHGSLFGSPYTQIIITEDDYARFRDDRKAIFELLKNEFATSSILYIGYSNEDPNWKMIMEEMRAEFYPSKMPISYRIAPKTDSIDKEILKSKQIETLDCTLEEFRQIAVSTLSDSQPTSEVVQRTLRSIPTDLSSIFENNPAATLRLLASWEYVNQAPFNISPNISDFLHGDRSNWSLVGQRLFFERDIEEQVYDDLLDYTTGSGQSPKIKMILGPAGYGTSTLLMGLAAKLVKDKAGPVLMHKPGMPLIEGDIAFAASVFKGKRPFLIIDNAADHSSVIYNSVHHLREIGNPALFLLGERLNEWRERHSRLTATEYLLEPLTDPEINRLIDYLSEHGELGVLRDLDRKLQFSVIKGKHGKELLVAMREATEGRGFDAILEDEYRNISNEMSRRLYLIVCCFYQHGIYIRDVLLANLLKLPLSSLYPETKDSTEGVVIYDLIDPSFGHYGARSRHRIIAEIVWQRCGSRAEQEDILISAMNSLNLKYKADRDAYESFIRSDDLVDSIKNLDGKIKFFERACQKDPDNPYARQHFARMLSREEKSEIALGQIEEAMRINPRIRVLYHTKGVILGQISKTHESMEVARKRFVQSEQAFRHCLSLYNKDEYAYHGLAQLYLDWARRVSDPAEVAEYISKAEAVIEEGLKTVRVRDSLWIISSEVQRLIGDHPSYLGALEQAVKSSPEGIVGRYLLGRAYRISGIPQKSKEILEPVITNHPYEFRSFAEYARAMLDLGEPVLKVIAVLNISTLYGLNDPRFIALLGGLLFMSGQYSKALTVFEESYKKEIPADEASTIQFRPNDPVDKGKPLKLKGKVVAVKAGYAFIEVPGYPRFYCPGSKFGGIILTQGLEVRFEPAFTARGAIVDKLEQHES